MSQMRDDEYLAHILLAHQGRPPPALMQAMTPEVVVAAGRWLYGEWQRLRTQETDAAEAALEAEAEAREYREIATAAHQEAAFVYRTYLNSLQVRRQLGLPPRRRRERPGLDTT
jgi:hypothetical protein